MKRTIRGAVLPMLLALPALGQEFPQALRPVPWSRAPIPIDAVSQFKRLQPVEIDTGLFDKEAAAVFTKDKPRKVVDFNLFDELQMRVQLDKVEYATFPEKTLIWTGTVLNTKRGQLVMAVTGKIHAATLTTDDGTVYSLQYAEDSIHWLRQLDPAKLPPDGEPVRVSSGDLPPVRRDPVVVADDGSLIDVMVLYTPAARNGAGGTTQMNTLIALGIAETNQGYANSGITQRVRLVHAAEVQYTESASLDTDLGRLRSTNDGFIDNAHTLRDTYRADIVSLWVNGGNYCGIAYMLTDLSSDFSSRAFNVVSRTCATGYYSFAHEMGHNMGATHDSANSGGPGLYSHSYGYQQKNSQPYFRTVMGYACSAGIDCQRVNYWSNPNGTYNGMATGISTTNNVLGLNNVRNTVANWRQATIGGLTISPSSASVGPSASTGSITVTAPAGTSWTAVSNASWITVTSGASGSGNGTVNYSVQANVANTARSGSIAIAGQAFTISQSGSTAPSSCATTLTTVPGTTNASLTAADCISAFRTGRFAKRYTFTATAGQQISIAMNSAVIDSYLFLLSPAGSLLTSDDDSGDGLNARIPGSGFYTLPATGLYTIEASTFSSGETGLFALIISSQVNCTYSIAPTSRTIDFNQNAGSIAVTAAAGCTWTSTSNASWISVSSQGSGAGSANVTYSALANAGAAARSGTITVAGQTFTLTQTGAPPSCGTGAILLGQTVNASLTSACSSQIRGSGHYALRYSFSASAGQQISILMTSPTLDTFLYLVGPNGAVVAQDDDSAGNLNSRIPPSGQFTLPQSGTYVIEATTFDYFQAGAFTLVLSGGCSYTVSPQSASFAAAGGTAVINVGTTAGCIWGAVSGANWITVQGGTGSSSGAVTYAVAGNPGAASRSGTLTVAGIAVSISQGGISSNCVVTPVVFPQVVNGTLTSNACVSLGSGAGHNAQRYSFTGTAGQQVSFAVTSTAFDTFLHLFGPNGNLLASDDDGGSGLNSRVPAGSGFFTLPSAGTHTVEVTSYGTGRTGGFTLTLATSGGGGGPAGNGPFRFVAVTPCRVADTRTGSGFSGSFGPPSLGAGGSRSIPVTQSACGIPPTARAFSLNVTVVPRGPLSYLTLWPSDQSQPLVSTLNSPLGRILANAAIVPASATGAVSVFVSDAADVIIDINGYFSPQ